MVKTAPLFMNNALWYDEEFIDCNDGGIKVIYKITTDAPEYVVDDFKSYLRDGEDFVRLEDI